MEKIINNTPFNTADMVAIAAWDSEESSETLYFSDCGHYLLHCIGNDAVMENNYGSASYSTEDLLVLADDDVLGWMKVHAAEAYQELFEDIVSEKLA